jgi:hypothetical protein
MNRVTVMRELDLPKVTITKMQKMYSLYKENLL